MASWQIATPLAAYSWQVENPRGQVLLQHGLGEYAERYLNQYNELIPKLNQLGLDVYAIDLPGHGNSPGTRGVCDLNECLEYHLLARRSLPTGLPTVLFGHSLGGLITAASVVVERGNIAAAIISSSALHSYPKRWERLLAGVSASLAPNAPMPLPRPGMEALTRDQQLLERIKADPMMDQGKARNLVAKTVLDLSELVWKKAHLWKAPTLIIHGDQDTSTNHKNSITLHERIPSPDKRLIIYPGGYHELLNDLERDAVERDLIGWLDQRI